MLKMKDVKDFIRDFDNVQKEVTQIIELIKPLEESKIEIIDKIDSYSLQIEELRKDLSCIVKLPKMSILCSIFNGIRFFLETVNFEEKWINIIFDRYSIQIMDISNDGYDVYYIYDQTKFMEDLKKIMEE